MGAGKILLIVVLLLSFSILCNSSLAKYSGGSGEPNDPYQIANAANLLTFAADTNDYNKCFIMTADIDLDPNLPGNSVFTTAVVAVDTNSSSSGFQGILFTGVFDGVGHEIVNLTINTNGVPNAYLGMFGGIGSGEVKCLGLENISITGIRGSVGGLVAQNTSGIISNCYSTGSITAKGSLIGGLVGKNEGSINNCFSNGYVNSTGCNNATSLGGLIGSNSGDINNCYSTGTVWGFGIWGIGGLVGINSGIIRRSYSTSSITTGQDEFVTVCGEEDVGGLVGKNDGTITNCYSTGSVTLKLMAWTGIIGGLVGTNRNNVSNCYSTGIIPSGITNGGLVGQNIGSINDSYFLITSGPNNGLGIPLTDTQMKQQGSFSGWDFVGERANGYEDFWRLCNEGLEYPKLAWQYLLGDIACPDGVEIFDLAELCEQWLFEEIPADLAPPPSGDGIVDFTDFAIFANQWGITNDIDELLDFTGQWLKMGLPICSADISPLPDGDGRVNASDFAVMANDWLEGL